ncbi:MarR family winged helix-turn-helix transcriptional regulator [Microbacterium sp. LWH7-1.2]|uniref:MarR family winged helix-turn-helix transcriptional regulator n=1 Tax=Microbacterium sp. LWH7-1.2 TaxID=3135257 RepID=UPI0031395B7A
MPNEAEEHLVIAAARINALVFELWLAVERDGPRYDEFELTGQQHAVLGRIVADPDITPRALAEALGVTKGAISQHLTLLKREGYLSRRRSDRDGRVHVLHLEERGRDYQAMLQRYQQYSIDKYITKLSATDVDEIVAALEKLRNAFA